MILVGIWSPRKKCGSEYTNTTIVYGIFSKEGDLRDSSSSTATNAFSISEHFTKVY